jgi:hypothetical protein
MNLAETMLFDASVMGFGAVSFVLLEAIVGINQAVFGHHGIRVTLA